MALALPPETIDTILDHLHDDQATLGLASLVCKAWTPTCRLHLFHRFTLTPWSIREFMDFLTRESSGIGTAAPYIVALELANFNRREVQTDQPCEDLAALWSLASHFTQVSRLIIVDCDFAAGSRGQDPSRGLAHFQAVRHLEMRKSHFREPSDVIRSACAFPSLESLSIDNVWSRVGSKVALKAAAAISLPSALSLRSLTFGANHGDVVRWLLHQRTPLNVNCVQFAWNEDGPSFGTEYPMSQFLSIYGARFERLAVDFRRTFDIGLGASAIDIGPCTNLRTFSVMNVPIASHTLSTPLRLISQINSAGLRSISVHLCGDPENLTQIDDEDWASLCAILCGPKLDGLNMVEFIIERVRLSEPCQDVRLLLMERLQPLHGRGIVKVQWI